MSVQANRTKYCNPRNDEGPYTSVEVGFPSEKDPMLLPFAEDPSTPTETVYGWVDSAVVLEVIESHGGWIAGELPPLEVSSRESL